MKHCLPDPKASEDFGDYFTVFSCEYDDGKRCTGHENIVRIGDDGKIMLLLCHSCLEQLRGQIINNFFYPIVMDALRKDKTLLQKIIEPALKKLSRIKNDRRL